MGVGRFRERHFNCGRPLKCQETCLPCLPSESLRPSWSTLCLLQGILLHSNGEIRPPSDRRGGEDSRRDQSLNRVGTLPRPQLALQQKQSDWGKISGVFLLLTMACSSQRFYIFFTGSRALPFSDWSHPAGVLQVLGCGQRSGAVLEEAHLQSDRSDGPNCARLLQEHKLDGATRRQLNADGGMTWSSLSTRRWSMAADFPAQLDDDATSDTAFFDSAAKNTLDPVTQPSLQSSSPHIVHRLFTFLLFATKWNRQTYGHVARWVLRDTCAVGVSPAL